MLIDLRQGMSPAVLRLRPSLDLRFERMSALPPTVNFVRASSATVTGSNGLLRTAGPHEPRFDHAPPSGAPLGLLIEEARTNVQLRSADPAHAYYTKGRVSVAAWRPAPDGSPTGAKLVEDDTVGNHQVYPAGGITLTAAAWTFSVFLKAAERTRARLVLESATVAGAVFDLSDGSVVSSDAGITPHVPMNYGNGWYRCAVTRTANAVTSYPAIRLVSSGTADSYTGDNASGLYIWGMQTELGSFPTSYIPTTTSPVSRSADQATLTLGPWFNAREGTLLAEATCFGAVGGVNNYVVELSDGTPTNELFIGNNNGLNGIRMLLVSNGMVQFDFQPAGTPFAGGAVVKAALAYRVDNSAAAVNGAVSAADMACSIGALTRMDLGRRHTGTSLLNGHLRRLSYHPRRLTAGELRQATARTQ